MSQDQRSGGAFDEREHTALTGLEADDIEATRLADVLGTAERGEVPDLDPTEDPLLASLNATAVSLRSSLEAASARAPFEVFHERSRNRVMAATPRSRVELASEKRTESLLQRWNGLLTSISSAAAAAVATFVVTVLAIGGGASTDPLAAVQTTDRIPDESPVGGTAQAADPEEAQVNLTALSVDDQISRYRSLVGRLSDLTNEGQPADAGLLREIADTSATVARAIEEQPSAVSGKSAWDAYQATFTGQQVLSQASVSSDDDQLALDTAQVVADGAFVTAARYLGNPSFTPTYDETVAAVATGPSQPEAAP